MSEKISRIHAAAPPIKAIRWPPQKDELPVEAFAELGRRLNRDLTTTPYKNAGMTILLNWNSFFAPGVKGPCGFSFTPWSNQRVTCKCTFDVFPFV